MKNFVHKNIKHINNEGNPDKDFWVYELILTAIQNRLDIVASLDRFCSRDLMGDAAWNQIKRAKQHTVAGQFFSAIVNEKNSPIEDLSINQKSGTKYYRVTV